MNSLLLTSLILAQASGKPAVPPAAAPAAGPAVTVTVRPQTDVAGSTITVGDIADITGEDKAFAMRVASVEVGPAPLVGLSRSLLKSDIVTRLRFNKIDLAKIDVVSVPTIKVTRVGAEVPVTDVVEFAANALREARKDRQDNAQIEPLPVPYKWIVPPGKREMQAGPVRGALDGGIATVPVTVLVEGKPQKSVDIAFRIKRLTTVLVATRQLEAHAVLKAEDVSLTQQEGSPGTVPLTDPALVVGMRTTRQIPAGAVLTKAAIESAPVISIGKSVDVEVVVGGIRIATSGVARQHGAVGERIRVFVSKTNKEISATVVDAKTVRVEDNG